MNNQKQVYSVSYDLNSPEQKYRDLDNLLTRLGGVRVMDSYWLVASPSNAEGIKISLMDVLDENDKLLIAQFNPLTTGSLNLSKEVAVWILANCFNIQLSI